MKMPRTLSTFLCASAATLLVGCAGLPPETRMDAFATPRVTIHRDGDDLLTAGLGLAGLRAAPPAFADAAHPTPVELRRRAIRANWQGIADLSPAGGYGTLYGGAPPPPGRGGGGPRPAPGAPPRPRRCRRRPRRRPARPPTPPSQRRPV
ncbi:3-hydroxybutyrate oligomer hydrolase family protein, partial [Lysobacter xanthus]